MTSEVIVYPDSWQALEVSPFYVTAFLPPPVIGERGNMFGEVAGIAAKPLSSWGGVVGTATKP